MGNPRNSSGSLDTLCDCMKFHLKWIHGETKIQESLDTHYNSMEFNLKSTCEIQEIVLDPNLVNLYLDIHS